MSLTPDWPDAPGPRVLMLVANDITIDTRVRKTASSVARAGYSVIALGIDTRGISPSKEVLDGALLVRVVPESDPRISPNRIRMSRPELTEALRYRAETRKQRLQVARRTLSADIAHATDDSPSWLESWGRSTASVARRLGVYEETSRRIGRRTTRELRRARRWFRFGPRKTTTILSQFVHQGLVFGSRFLARPSRPFLRKATWRRDIPDLHHYEVAVGPLIDSLEPDLIHAHDIFLLGIAARAKARAVRAGREVRLIYDAHEYVPGLPIDQRRRDAYENLENEYFDRADSVITVSPGLAELLKRRFGGPSAVVLNAPDTRHRIQTRNLRDVLDIPAEAPLVVYVGGVAPHRGAEVLVEAVARLAGSVHLAFVSNSTTGYVRDLLELGRSEGLNGRIHIAPYVAPEAVVSYISTATVSAIPLSRQYVNYEIALPNKLFQSIHAGVPVAVSDNPEMARFVREHGVGEVFAGGNPNSLRTVLEKMIEAPERYTAALSRSELLETISWAHQEETLLTTYRKVRVGGP